MSIRTALLGTALLAGGALLALPASARAIRTDAGNIISCTPDSGQLAFSTGLTGTPDACTLSPSDDQGIGVGPYEVDATTVYTWDNDDAADNWQTSVQVAEYTLDGNFGDGSSSIPVDDGDTEFSFNYDAADGSGCLVNPSSLASAPTLTFDNVTYQFTGANGAALCGSGTNVSTSDFVFGSTGYVGWIDADNVLETGSLPLGWTTSSSSSSSVPEPSSLALTLIGVASLAAAFALGRRRRLNH